MGKEGKGKREGKKESEREENRKEREGKGKGINEGIRNGEGDKVEKWEGGEGNQVSCNFIQTPLFSNRLLYNVLTQLSLILLLEVGLRSPILFMRGWFIIGTARIEYHKRKKKDDTG